MVGDAGILDCEHRRRCGRWPSSSSLRLAIIIITRVGHHHCFGWLFPSLRPSAAIPPNVGIVCWRASLGHGWDGARLGLAWHRAGSR